MLYVMCALLWGHPWYICQNLFLWSASGKKENYVQLGICIHLLHYIFLIQSSKLLYWKLCTVIWTEECHLKNLWSFLVLLCPGIGQCGRSHFSNGCGAQMEQLHMNKETAASSVGQENKWFCATHLILEQMAYLSLCLFFLI